MSQMDFLSDPGQPFLNSQGPAAFEDCGETDVSTPSCAISLHHRFWPQTLWDLNLL